SANGRMYYQINSWFRLLDLMPFSKRIKPVWRQSLGVKSVESPEDKASKKLAFRYRVLAFCKAAVMSWRLPARMKKLDSEFQETRRYFNEQLRPNMNNQELLDLYRSIKDKVLKNWDLTLSNDTYAFAYSGLLRWAASDSDLELNEFLSRVGGVESMKPVIELAKLVNQVVEEDRLIELKKLSNDQEAADYLKSKSDPLAEAINRFIGEYGDRSLAELKLESPTWRTSPHLLIQEILQIADSKTRLNRLNSQAKAHQTAGQEIKGSSVLRRPLIKYFRKRALIGIKNREISRLNRSRIFGMVRAIFMQISQQLYEQKALEEPEDIFYLTIDEVERLVDTPDSNINELIERRRQEYLDYAGLPAYSHLVFAGQVFDKTAAHQSQTDVVSEQVGLSGSPCSNGEVEGEVLIVSDPRQAKSVEGKILVTKMTDPGWVFLMVAAKGIIAEKGSLLSHTAIISRELGIPAVVGVDKATSLLKTGDMIRMNGGNGKIDRLK
ncbi:MAG: PEP-utilizing enzyme, partial [Candidatus Saccharimonadales bacterium]|nr:PEP-utilizing enzyme [Candidatus Saccharimonadales bacterium]